MNSLDADVEKKYNNTHENEDTDCKQLIHDTVINAYEIEWQRTHDIENKATGIVGFVGIIFSLTVATLSSLLTSEDGNIRIKIFSDFAISYLIIFIILTLMIFSIILGIKALNVKKWWFLLSDKFVEYCNRSKVTKEVILEKIIDEMTKGTKANSNKNDKIANYLKWSYTLFIASAILLALYIMYLIYICK